MSLNYFGLLVLLWTQRFSPSNEELFNYLKTRYTFYLLTPIYRFYFILLNMICNGHDRPCDSLILEYLSHVRIMLD